MQLSHFANSWSMKFYVNELLLLYTDSLYASAVYYSVQYSSTVHLSTTDFYVYL